MRYDRDGFLGAIRARLERAGTAGGGVDGGVVCGPAADAELRGLLRTADPRTDMEARHAAGWLCVARAMAGPADLGSVHGSMAGTLLFPVWVADPGLVPPELAERYATADPATRPDPANADGPAEWSALCAAFEIAAQGRRHTPPPDATEDVRRLHELAASFDTRALSYEARLASAVGCGSLAVLATPEYDPRYADRRAALSSALARAGMTWPFGDLSGDGAAGGEAADPVRLAHRALKAIPADSPERLVALEALGGRLLDRYLRSYDPEDLHEAVGIARDVLDQLPPGSPRTARCLSTLGRGLTLLRQREGATPEECDELVDLCRRARHGSSQGPAAGGYDLGMALVLRAQHTGRVEDLHEAVAVLAEALPAARHPGESAALRNALGNALRARSLATGAPADLDAARHLTDPATASPGVADDPRPPLLAHAMTLFSRYTRDPEANRADLDEAVRRLRQAEPRIPPGHPERPAVLNALGLALTARHQRTGDPEVLNEAVRAHREAVALTPEGHEVLKLRLLNLGTALGLRHQLTEDGEDLRGSLECRHRAAALPGLGRAHQAALLSSTGIILVQGIERATDPDARIEEAVRILREALALTPEDDPRLPRRRHNLAIALLARHGRTRRSGDAREARQLADAVVAELPADSPELPGALMAAARVRLAGPLAPLSSTARDEALALFRRAVAATPPGHPKRTSRLTMLGAVLYDRGLGRRRRGADPDEAATVFRAAALERQCAPSTRLEAAWLWGDVRAQLGDWDGALDGYVLAVDLLHSVAPRHLVREDQEFLLGRSVGLGAAAAACAVRCGRPGLAVGLLEAARGVILSHAFDADSDLTRLRESAPDLADRFEELRDALDTATGTRELLEEGPPDPHTRADLRQRLAAEWRELTDRIRAEHPELDLLRPVREWDRRELCATAAAGPVVLVNLSPYGSDALVVTEHSIDAVPLPGLDPRTTAARRQAFQEALVRIETPGTSRKQSLRAQRTVRDTLAWLWQAVTGPVLDRLPTATRVWWSPGGPLGILPLHAAAPAGAPGALDRVVSSYTPTLRALHHARRRAARPAGTGTLVVSVARAVGQAPLPGARREADHLARLLPGATLLADGSATHSAVVSALHHHAYAHFACHALGDAEHPSGSRLVLHDHTEHPLTAGDLARLRLPSVRLAYLSACDTLRTSPELADEAVHIVSAFQMAGFPHVVGSLWHVDDAIGAEVALSVYEAVHTGGGALDVARTAEALHQAVRALRDTYPLTPSLWACQVHAGP
ncbi:CHAT domain-containing protein [Streptomyces palmae]|uniref:CHAT domain-containing protein n=1 Tax=Streptomyces palmae TaxID=1701085 RepID=A0A4Z0HCF6_9ACTN|nr:CHAT domain-containing protein [Streptomyces palmae]TGB17373.1 CHAT domain-containing protein [Streptomyces palmae]